MKDSSLFAVEFYDLNAERLMSTSGSNKFDGVKGPGGKCTSHFLVCTSGVKNNLF